MNSADRFFSPPREKITKQEYPHTLSRFKAIWISDIQLGSPQCHAERLLELLQLTESETLYFVGDLVDSSELKRQQYWDQSHHDVVQAIFDKAKQGTKVVFMPCNHDAPFRKLIGLDLEGIQIRDELVHVTAQGKRMLVMHGDRFDSAARSAFWLRYCGATFAPKILRTLQAMNDWRERIGLPDWPASGLRETRLIDAVYLRSIELALTNEAKQKGLDGVICSHVHKPEIRDISGILYCNDGDWVEHQSAAVEDLSGALRLITWHDIILQADRAALYADLAEAES